MIDRLPPSMHPAATSQPAGPRAQPATSFDQWIRPAVRDGSPNAGGDNDRTSASSEVAAAVLRDAGQAQEIGEAMFSFHVRGKSGAVEVFSVPWRLGANAALSHLTRAAYEAGTLLDLRAASESVRQTVSPAHASTAAPAASQGTPTSTIPTSAPFASRASLTSASQVGPRSAVELGSATPAAIAEPWLARLLRLLDQQGHDSVLWIRDYRLDDAAAQAMVAEVRSMAERQGWKLERIMVNGRDLWHSPHAPDSMRTP